MTDIKNYRKIGNRSYRIAFAEYQGMIQATAFEKNVYGQERAVGQVYATTKEAAWEKLKNEVA